MEQFDQSLLDKIVHELKSQGIFDQFRRECMSDVDTKPAYQNLRQRVDGSVSSFLSTSKWRPDLNKNQLRETLRKHIQNSGFLDTGVERIVDQVVNPKIGPLFLPKVEEIVYDCLGLNKRGMPEKMVEKSSTKTDELADLQLMSSLSEDVNRENKQNLIDENVTKTKEEFNLNSLLPQDLEPISPASEEKLADTNESDDDNGEDEEISPPFEPHIDGNSNDSQANLDNSFSSFETEINLNSDIQAKTNTNSNENSENVEVEHGIKESLPEYDILAKDNKCNKHIRSLKMINNNLNNHEMYKKTSPKSDDNETSSVEPETSVGSSLITETSDEISSSQEKVSRSTKTLKLNTHSHNSDSEIVCDSTTIESNKKAHKAKIANSSSVSSSHHYKKSHSSSKSSTKDHHHRHYHRHDSKKSSHSSSHNSKSSSKLKHSEYDKKDKSDTDKRDKEHKRYEDNDVKHKMRAQSKDEKVKHKKCKIVHESQTKESEASMNGNFLTNDNKDKVKGNHSDLKDSVESRREDTYIESKHGKHRHSSKHYSAGKKEDHSWNENELSSTSVANIRDEKKSIDRDKRHKLSQMKYSKKHKSSEKFKEGRSSDRENYEQREELNNAGNSLHYQSDSQSHALPGNNMINQSSRDIILIESEEETNHDNSNIVSENNQYSKIKKNAGELEGITLKPNIKKIHSNVYEARKKMQARKSLERLRKKREQTEVEQKKIKNTNFDVTNTAEEKNHSHHGKAFIEENTEIIHRYSVDYTDTQLTTSNSGNENVQIFPIISTSSKLEYDHTKTKKLCKVPNVCIRKITSSNGENTNMKPKFEVKLQPNSELDAKQKINEVLVIQANKTEKLVSKNNENTNFSIVKINSNNDISVMPINSDINPNIPTIRCISKKKKSVMRSHYLDVQPRKSDENKRKISRKRICSYSNDETMSDSGDSDSIVHSRGIDGNFDGSRQNKILKLIIRDGKNETSFEEKDSLNSSQSTEDDVCSQTYSNSTQTDTEDYNKKPPKLATKLMDVALQDLLLESGLSLPCSNESQRRLNTNVKQGTSSTKKIKQTTEKSISTHQQQHYEKSDLYKPRPCFTKSSKRSRRGDTHDDASLGAGNTTSRR